MKWIVSFLALAAVLAGGAFAWANRHAEIPKIARPDPASFDRKLVARGEELAGLGNCHVCHTSRGGRPYAGGLPLPTPFGVVHATNITPDVETGIGAWSEQAFIRAMREGIDRSGRHLYPAFPYDYFTKVTTEDLRAIYAYLMTRPPVSAKSPDNALRFPFNIRFLVEGWNTLFLDQGEFRPDPSKDAEWNRGAYLVEGLGHCGACHSPRNIFGAAAKTGPNAYGGGAAEGWHVPPLNGSASTPAPWTQKALVNYLIDGWDAQHGGAAGPMLPIVNDLYERSEDDVFAIAAYVMTLRGTPPPQSELDSRLAAATAFATKREWGHPENPPIPDDPVLRQGAKVFESQCATCHKSGGNPAPLALGTAINGPDPANLIRAVLEGVPAPAGSRGRTMPPRATQINDADMAALAAFVRNRFTDKPAWSGVAEAVREARAAAH